MVIACAKANDCPKFQTKAVRLDPRTMTYTVEPAFDLKAWKAAVDGKAKATSLCSIQDVADSVAAGNQTTAAIIADLKTTFAVSKSTAERVIRNAIKADHLIQSSRGRFEVGPTYLP
jgi:hypothetical protein